MNELMSKPLSQIVNEQHKTASVFDKYNLDYCCKGKRCLEQACSESHVAIDEVIEELRNIYAVKSNELDFNKIKLYQLAEYIVYTHHSYLRKEMPQIVANLEKVTSKHGKRHSELYDISAWFNQLSNEMTKHIQKEETILFPRIKQLETYGFGKIPDHIKNAKNLQLPIADMEDEHEDAGNIMAGIKSITNNYEAPKDACTTFKLLYARLKAFEVDLHQHVHLENSILFPKALALERQLKLDTHN